MCSRQRPIGIPDANSLAHAKRIIGMVMQALSLHPTWRNPLERVTVHAAVDRCVTSLIEAGETDDAIISAEALRVVASREPGRSNRLS